MGGCSTRRASRICPRRRIKTCKMMLKKEMVVLRRLGEFGNECDRPARLCHGEDYVRLTMTQSHYAYSYAPNLSLVPTSLPNNHRSAS